MPSFTVNVLSSFRFVLHTVAVHVFAYTLRYTNADIILGAFTVRLGRGGCVVVGTTELGQAMSDCGTSSFGRLFSLIRMADSAKFDSCNRLVRSGIHLFI